MKKKLLILSASIGLILACFPFTLCAEEDPESDLGVSAPYSSYTLDDYFYQNYDILPYIESTGSQYINTGINGSSELCISFRISDISSNSTGWNYITGVRQTNKDLALNYSVTNSNISFWLYNAHQNNSFITTPYSTYKFVICIRSDIRSIQI